MVRRILHVSSTRGVVGGAEAVLVALLREGEARGWPQLVVNPFAEDRTDSALARAVSPGEYVGLPCTSVRGLPGLRRALRRAVRDFAPDLLHAHLVHAAAAVASLKRRGEVRVLSHQHGRLLLNQGRYPEAAVDHIAGHRFDRVVACSDDVRHFLLSSCGYAPDTVVTIKNGWRGAPEPQCGLAPVPTAVCVANLRREKGHAVLLDAWRQVVSAVPDAQLLLLGDGPLRHALGRKTAELGLHGQVELVGKVGNVWPHLARAHVFVLPSLHEPFGIVVVEAMAAGLPVVASAVGGLPELVEPGVTGQLVPPADHNALAQALIDLLTSPECCARLGAAGRRRASGYTMERTVAEYMALYDDLLGRRQ